MAHIAAVYGVARAIARRSRNGPAGISGSLVERNLMVRRDWVTPAVLTSVASGVQILRMNNDTDVSSIRMDRGQFSVFADPRDRARHRACRPD
jgi:hypothetical protein